jgi:hypothetical protein
MPHFWWVVKDEGFEELVPEKIRINAIRHLSQLNKAEGQVIEKGLKIWKMSFQYNNAKTLIADIAKEKKVKLLIEKKFSRKITFRENFREKTFREKFFVWIFENQGSRKFSS